MKPSQIKTECELIYTQIKSLEERRTRLRSICKHPDTYGDTFLCTDYGMKSTFCSDCGKVISSESPSTTTTTTEEAHIKWEKLADINRKEI